MADRPTTPPSPGPARKLRMPRVAERTLRSGLRVVVVRKPSVPKVELQLRVPFGKPSASRAAEHMLSSTLTAGTAVRSSAEIAKELQRLGASLDASVSADFFSVSASALKPHLGAFTRLLGEVLTEASFPAEEIELERARALQELHIARSQPQFVALEALRKRLFGRHPYAVVQPDPEAVGKVGRGAIRGRYADRVRPRGGVLVVVGDVQPARVLDAIEEGLRPWRGRSSAQSLGAPKAVEVGPMQIVDRPGSVQTNIRLAGPAVPPAHPDSYALTVANAIFGGTFMSRLVQNIREDKGFTYSPHSQVQHMIRSSLFEVGADVSTEVTAPSLVEIRYELSRMAAVEVASDELEAAKRYLVGIMAVQIQSQRGLASQLSRLFAFGLGLDHLRDYPKRIMATGASDVREVSERYLAPERLTGVLVGDRSRIADRVGAIEAVDD